MGDDSLVPAEIESSIRSLMGDVGFRDGILNLQDFMLSFPKEYQKLEECTLRHFFAPGCYGREMTIPAGVAIIGKIHKHAHLNIISKGKVAVATEFGVARFEAPYTFISEPGTKRFVRAIEETIWTTIHVTDETDLEKVEDYVIAKTYEEYEQFKALESNPTAKQIGEAS